MTYVPLMKKLVQTAKNLEIKANLYYKYEYE